MTCYDTLLMNDADDLLNEAGPNFWQWQGMQHQEFLSHQCVCHQKLLVSFILEQGEMQPHLEDLLRGNLHLLASIERLSVLTFSLQITHRAENLAKRCFMVYSAKKNSLSVDF